MKSIIKIALSLLFFSSCNNFANSERPKSPEELRAELKIYEASNPLLYIRGESFELKRDMKLIEKHLFRADEYAPDGCTITGKLKNSASIAKFKDVVVKLNWVSQTESLINSDEFTIYESIAPNGVVSVSFKAYPPDAMKQFYSEIIGATPDYR